MNDRRTVLSVVGPHSGCGKTLFITALLRHIGGLGCLKMVLMLVKIFMATVISMVMIYLTIPKKIMV